ncbi:MAG: hypothetical protein FWH51_02830 [Dehalococcoidia bacterium]|nr:hypothetical protein [Dehalococcoidia bacterium]
MSVKELNRKQNNQGQTIVEIETGKQVFRLINTYDNQHTLEELIYTIARRRLADRVGLRRELL